MIQIIYIIQFDTDNYTEYFLIQITCLISLLHNNFNKSVISFLLRRFKYTSLINNKITYYNHHKDGYDDIDSYFEEDHLFNILSFTPNKVHSGYIHIY